MEDSKDLLLSKSTWGAVILLLAPLLNHFGITIEDQEAVVQAIVAAIGGVVFVWGALTRKTEIGSIAGVKIK